MPSPRAALRRRWPTGVLIVVLITINTVADEAERATRHRTRPTRWRRSPCRSRWASERRRRRRHPRERGRGRQAPGVPGAGRGDPEHLRALRTGTGGAGAVRRRGLRCPGILNDLQALAPAFPGVRFAGVAIKGGHAATAQAGADAAPEHPGRLRCDGALAALYKVASCPQVKLCLPGGVVQSKALLGAPTPGGAARARERAGGSGASARLEAAGS